MNKNDFRSAYNKIALPEEVRAEMREKLLAQFGDESKAESAAAGSGFAPATEIKLPQKKKTGIARRAALIGSAAAVVAAVAVGAGVILNREDLTSMPDPVVNPATAESSGTAEASTEDADLTGYTRKLADGVLRYQKQQKTTAEHSEPQAEASAEELPALAEKLRGIINKDAAPAGFTLTAGKSSDTGFALEYASGEKWLNISVSTEENEFLPITLPDGSYITAEGDDKSSFAVGSLYNFIDPECRTMAAGSLTDGDTAYYSAEYSMEYNGTKYYFRLDGKALTDDEFADCICGMSVRLRDHRGWYNPDASKVDLGSVNKLSDGYILPGALSVNTDWGTLSMEQLTVYAGSAVGVGEFNIQARNDMTDPGEYGYSLKDAAEFSGLDILNEFTAEHVLGGVSTGSVTYAAAYDGITSPHETSDIYGANLEMLPGDDPEQFAEAQKYVKKSNVNVSQEDGSVIDEEYGCSYSTDKLDYFRDKTRTGARYQLDYYRESTGESVIIRVLDNWDIYGMGMVTVGRYPAAASGGFISGKDGCGSLYTARGFDNNGEFTYLGGFRAASGKYVLLEMHNVTSDDFSALLAELYADSIEPEIPVETDENGYYTRRCADGILRFQELNEVTDSHAVPDQPMDGKQAHDKLNELFSSTRSLPGMDDECAYYIELMRQAGENAGIDNDQVKEMIDRIPLGYEAPYAEGWYSDTGFAAVCRSSDGSVQANLSISDKADEFIPITLPDGGYLMPVGEYRSSFAAGSGYNFIDPEFRTLAAGSYTVGGDTYYAVLTSAGGKFLRLDAKNITLNKLLSCMEHCLGINTADHSGFYSTDGTGAEPGYALDTVYPEDNARLPAAHEQATEWGKLTLNSLTYSPIGWNGGYRWNISYSRELQETPAGEHGYDISDIAEASGLDSLMELSAPGGGEWSSISYNAIYDGVYSDPDSPNHGANPEMRPGDDPEEFAEAQEYIDGVYTYESGTGEAETDYDGSFYTTDKLDYFSGKNRTSASYELAWRDGAVKQVSIVVMNDWTLYDNYYKFGQLPPEGSADFITPAPGNGRLYAGTGLIEGGDCSLGGFRTANGWYVIVESRNCEMREFARILAALYSNTAEPAAIAQADYPGLSYNISGFLSDGDIPGIGWCYYNEIRLDDYSPDLSGTVYFGSVEEALSAERKLLGYSGAEVLTGEYGWTLVPEESAVLKYDTDGEISEITLFFTKDGCEVRMSASSEGATYNEPRITLPGGKVIRIAGSGYESSILTRETIENMNYLENSEFYQAGFGGRYDGGVPYYCFRTSGFKVGGYDYDMFYMIDSKGLEEADFLNVFQALYYGRGRGAVYGEYAGEGEAPDKAEYVELSLGSLNENPLYIYPDPEFTSDTGETAITAEQAQEFLKQFPGTPEIPFEVKSVGFRRCTAQGGYVSESVTFYGDTQSMRLCHIINGAALTGYGEKYGPGVANPEASYFSLNDNYPKGSDVICAHAKLKDGTDVRFGIFRNKIELDDSGSEVSHIYSVTTENIGALEFVEAVKHTFISQDN